MPEISQVEMTQSLKIYTFYFIEISKLEHSNGITETKDAFRKLPLQDKERGIHQNVTLFRYVSIDLYNFKCLYSK